ncbi:MAG: PIN domain-containing protein [Pirellulales bacterium]
MILVDTSAWYAAYVPSDPRHQEIAQLLAQHGKELFTTDFVIDETITLLRARGERSRAISFGKDLLISGVTPIEFVTLPDLVNAYQVLIQYRDKAWSFTDCTSLVVMQRLSNREVISLDEHFRQMPSVAVYP